MTLSARRLTFAMTAAAGVVIAAVAAIVLTPHPPDAQKYRVPMPPPGASARQVVVAYLHALDAHDTATAEQLSTAGFRSTTQSWLQLTGSIQHITMQNVYHYARQGEYDATVTFRFTSQPGRGDDSFPDGSHYWGYVLVPRHGRLLVSDDGTG
jgi:hypothetical protein